jgi:FkbM family methyltransferase
MTVARRLELARHEAKRVVQTQRAFRNWPALLKDMAGATVGRGAPELTFQTKRGPRLTCPNLPGARLPLYEQFADDCYRIDWLLGPLAGAPLHVIDVGAHIGSFAVNLAVRNPGTTVECYEPSPESAKYLRRNVEQNGLHDRITVHEAALAAEAGWALLDDNSGGSVHNGLMQAEHRLVEGDDALGARGAVKVTTTTFDQAVAAAPAAVDLVKMDCEGGEYGLVYASSPSSWRSVQRVVLEYHPVAGESWDELRDWFGRVGLGVIRHEANGVGLGTAWLSRSPA